MQKMKRRRQRPSPLPLLLLLLLAAARGGHAQQQHQKLSWSVVDGQPLASAIAAWGQQSDGGDASYSVGAWTIARLGGATFATGRSGTTSADSRPPFSSGTFSILGAAPLTDSTTGALVTTPSVVDAAMRAELVPRSTTAQVLVGSVALVNLCLEEVQIQGLVSITAAATAILPLNLARTTIAWNGTVTYLQPRDIATFAYVVIMSNSPWTAVTQRYVRQMNGVGTLLQKMRVDVYAHEVHLRALPSTPALYNRVQRSVAKPNDPLLDFMRQEGLLMVPRWCGNGSLVPAEIAGRVVDAVWAPLFMADTPEGVAAGLVGAAALAPAQDAQQLPVPGVMVFTPNTTRVPLGDLDLPGATHTNATTTGNDSNSNSTGAAGGLRVVGPLLLQGSMGPDPRALDHPVLDLAQRASPLLRLSGAARLYVARLAFHVPALPLALASPTPNATAGAPPPVATSAFPLTALAVHGDATTPTDAAPTAAWLELYNVVAVVPALDFLALLTLATDGDALLSVRGCMEGEVLRQAAALEPGIQVLKPAIITWDKLCLGTYTGWGANARILVLLPAQPVPDAVTQRCGPLRWPSSSPAAGNGTADQGSEGGGGGGGGGGASAALIAGCAVGGAAALGLAAAAALLWRARTRRRYAGQDKEAAAAASLHFPWASAKAAAAGKKGAGGSGTDSASRASSDGPAAACGGPAAGSPRGAEGDGSSGGGDDVVALLQSQEQQLLRRAGTGLAAGGAAAAAAVGGLDEAHTRLMASVVAVAPAPAGAGAEMSGQGKEGGGAEEQQGSAEGEVPGSDLEAKARRGIERLAVRLEHQGGGGNTVVVAGEIGRGGGGTVYLGMWRELPVAVKTIVFEAWEGDAAAAAAAAAGAAAGGGGQAPNAHFRSARAIMETAISASVGHRHVVATYTYDVKRMGELDAPGSLKVTGELSAADAPAAPQASGGGQRGVQAYKAFLVQELCTASLGLVVRQGVLQRNPGRLSVVADLLRQVALGLGYLHGLGIIHGDLTPNNVLLKADGGEPSGLVAKLADFGLSQRLDAQATHVSGFGAGTPFYVAPEVVTMKRTSLAADVYSFGVIAWELYTGLPVAVYAHGGAAQRHPAFPSFPAVLPQPPDGVQKLVHRCLRAVPSLRPPASELVAFLSGGTAANGEGTPAALSQH